MTLLDFNVPASINVPAGTRFLVTHFCRTEKKSYIYSVIFTKMHGSDILKLFLLNVLTMKGGGGGGK
jgi:hypothetical protein